MRVPSQCQQPEVLTTESPRRSLCKYMRTECLEHHYVYESPMPVQRLVVDIADKCQVKTPPPPSHSSPIPPP